MQQATAKSALLIRRIASPDFMLIGVSLTRSKYLLGSSPGAPPPKPARLQSNDIHVSVGVRADRMVSTAPPGIRFQQDG